MTTTSARPGDGIDAAAYARHASAIAVIMNLFFVRHLIETYRAFDGDVLEAIVLGEIAHHNIAAIRTAATSPQALSEALGQRRATGAAALLPTNAYSLAQATGIPRETVRRKIARLEQRGWISRDVEGSLFVTDRPAAHFAAFNVARCAELLQAAGDIDQLLGAVAMAPASAGASGTRRRPGRRSASRIR
jgi:DNA-binding MarR family transcriptional regulator